MRVENYLGGVLQIILNVYSPCKYAVGSWAHLLWADLVVELEDVHDAVFDVL